MKLYNFLLSTFLGSLSCVSLSHASNEIAFCASEYADQIFRTRERALAIERYNCMEPAEFSELMEMIEETSRETNELLHQLHNQELLPGDSATSQIEASLRVLSHDYKRVQERLSYCRSKLILAEPTTWSDWFLSWRKTEDDHARIFFQALGDPIGKTELEGYDPARNLEHRQKELKSMRNALKGRHFIMDADQASPCAQMGLAAIPRESPLPDFDENLLDKLIQQSERAQRLMSAIGKNLASFYAEMNALTGELNEGESLFLPSGWTMHAIIYQFTKEKGGKTFTFRIFNGGEGIQYHASAQVGFKTQTFPFMQVSKVPAERIKGLVFLKALQEIQSPNLYPTKPKDFYESLLPILNGELEPITASAELLKDPQNSGTCSYYSMPWVLSSSVSQYLESNGSDSQRVADHIEYFIGLRTLEGYASFVASRAPARRNINLLQKGLTFFAWKGLQWHDEGTLDDGLLAAAVDAQAHVKTQSMQLTLALNKKESASARMLVTGLPRTQTIVASVPETF